MGDQCFTNPCGYIEIYPFDPQNPPHPGPRGLSRDVGAMLPHHYIVKGSTITIGDGIITKTFEFNMSAHAYGRVVFDEQLAVPIIANSGLTIVLTDFNDVVRTFEFRFNEGAVTPGRIWIDTNSLNTETYADLFVEAVNAAGFGIQAGVTRGNFGSGFLFNGIWLISTESGPAGNKPITGTVFDDEGVSSLMGMQGGSDEGSITPGNIEVIGSDTGLPESLANGLSVAITTSGLNITATVGPGDVAGSSRISLVNKSSGPQGNVPIETNWGEIPYPGMRATEEVTGGWWTAFDVGDVLGMNIG